MVTLAFLALVGCGSSTGTEKNGDLRIKRYHVSSDPNMGDPASAKPILSVAHSTYSNHNGGLALSVPTGCST
jgi:ABC-type oligopeptide transport system substrate-binding subunit